MSIYFVKIQGNQLKKTFKKMRKRVSKNSKTAEKYVKIKKSNTKLLFLALLSQYGRNTVRGTITNNIIYKNVHIKSLF